MVFSAVLGVLLLILALGAVIAFPFSGFFMDRLGAGKVTRMTTVAYVLSLVLIPLAPDTIALAAALWLFGAVHGAMDVAMNGWAAKLEAGYGRPIMSSFHGLFSVGAGLGLPAPLCRLCWNWLVSPYAGRCGDRGACPCLGMVAAGRL